LAPDVLVAVSLPAALALKRATKSIPIVFIGVEDPVVSGLLTNIARPEGNITGLANVTRDTYMNGHRLLQTQCPRSAISRHMQRGEENLYSTTASARATIDGGTARPSTFAALRLMTNSTVVDRSTGRSAGFTPPRILPTKPAARLAFSLRFGP
jgi:hypothetical protein